MKKLPPFRCWAILCTQENFLHRLNGVPHLFQSKLLADTQPTRQSCDQTVEVEVRVLTTPGKKPRK